MLEIEKGAKELNIPIIRDNRKSVASENGGLHNSPCLIFNPTWNKGNSQFATSSRFSYPSLSDVMKPTNDEDIAFMSVCSY